MEIGICLFLHTIRTFKINLKGFFDCYVCFYLEIHIVIYKIITILYLSLFCVKDFLYISQNLLFGRPKKINQFGRFPL